MTTFTSFRSDGVGISAGMLENTNTKTPPSACSQRGMRAVRGTHMVCVRSFAVTVAEPTHPQGVARKRERVWCTQHLRPRDRDQFFTFQPGQVFDHGLPAGVLFDRVFFHELFDQLPNGDRRFQVPPNRGGCVDKTVIAPVFHAHGYDVAVHLSGHDAFLFYDNSSLIHHIAIHSLSVCTWNTSLTGLCGYCPHFKDLQRVRQLRATFAPRRFPREALAFHSVGCSPIARAIL